MARVSRIDVGRLGTVERTTQGGIRVPAFLSRVGIQEYVREDGTIQREYRPADEVFSDASLQSAVDAVVTDFHQGMVNPANYREVTVGHVSGFPMPKQDGDYLSAEMVILDANEIALIDAGERIENSCGYDCTLDMTPGVDPITGQSYDAVQRNITINHVALLPRGFGRAGEAVSLRLDAKDGPVFRLDSKSNAVPLVAPQKEVMTVKRKDEGVPPDVDPAKTDAEVCATCGAPVDAEGKHVTPVVDADPPAPPAEAEAKMDALRKENAKLQAKLDAATEKLAARTDSKSDSESARERASAERTALKAGVAEAKLDALDLPALKREVIAKVFPQRKLDGRDEHYVEAVYDSAREVLASGEFRPTVEAKAPEVRADSNKTGDVFAEVKNQLEKDGLR
jgi:hypothetical protein